MSKKHSQQQQPQQEEEQPEKLPTKAPNPAQRVTSTVFAGPFHPMDDVHVSTCPSAAARLNARCWRLCLLPPDDKVLLLKMHKDPRCDVPITVYLFAVMTLQRIFRGVLVRRRIVFVLTHPDARSILNGSRGSGGGGGGDGSSYDVNSIDWNGLRFRYWRLAESVVAERYQDWYPSLLEQIATRSAKRETADRFMHLRNVVCAKWQAALLNREFSRWADYDRWQVYFVAAASIQRAFRDHRRLLLEMAKCGGAAAAATAAANGDISGSSVLKRKRRYLVAGSTKGVNTRTITAAQLAERNHTISSSSSAASSPVSLSSPSAAASSGGVQNNATMMSIMAPSPKSVRTRGEYRHDHFLPHSARGRQDFAAAVIQELWHRFVYRRVFLLFVRLIKSRQGAATYHVLKAVSPSEAYLADKASSLHARFRLAAPVNPKDKYPPAIVFKIFTHSNVADICAFAPRNYVADRQIVWGPNLFARLSEKKQSELDEKMAVMAGGTSNSSSLLAAAAASATGFHKSGNGANMLLTKSDVLKHNSMTRQGWYRRVDNNEWRLVADVALLSKRECGPEVLDATITSAAAHFFNNYLQVSQKERLPHEQLIDDYITLTSHHTSATSTTTTRQRAEQVLRECTRAKRVAQRDKHLKQKQREWMVSLYAGSETAVAQAAINVQQIVKSVKQVLAATAPSQPSNNNTNKSAASTTSNTSAAVASALLSDDDIARLTRHEARRAVDNAFDCLTEEEQQEESERLLQWTEHLDVKKYAQDWLSLGTTK